MLEHEGIISPPFPASVDQELEDSSSEEEEAEGEEEATLRPRDDVGGSGGPGEDWLAWKP